MIDFSKPLEPKILNIEDKTRSNLFTWRGQFSPQLVESLLEAYCPDNENVFDPFVGSGTVLYEAGKRNLNCYGCEINPAAWAFSKIYELISISPVNRNKILKNLYNLIISEFSYNIFNPKLLSNVEIENKIDRIGKVVGKREQTILNSLVILLDLYSKTHSGESIQSVFIKLSSLIKKLPCSSSLINCYLADSRNSPLSDGSIGFILTSPPYINVFNYHQNYRKSAESLGWDLLEVARSEIGSNRANRGNRFLTVIQYCLDMAMVLAECERVLKIGGKAIFIVGYESSVLHLSFYNSKIIQDLVCCVGGLKIIQKQKRIFKNKFGKNIREDIIHIKKVFKDLSYTNDLINKARQISINSLNANLKYVEPKNLELLNSAINKAKYIKPIQIFNSTNYEEYHTKEFVMMVKEAYKNDYDSTTKTA